MAILITGGCGYIGSHTVKALVEKGEKVLVIDNLSAGHQSAIDYGSLTYGSCGGASALRRLFKNYDIEAVIHFAAKASVPDSCINPDAYYHSNVCNTLVLLGTMADFGCKKIIFSSSAAVYGEPASIPIREDAPKNPTNPYGRTKLMIEQVLADYEVAYDLKHISFRYFNAAGAAVDGSIGEDHRPEQHLIPSAIKAIQEGTVLNVYGTEWDTPDGTCIRDFVHVSDIAEAHIAGLNALRNGNESDVFNLGGHCGFSVLEVVQAIERITDHTIPLKFCEARPGDPARLVADGSRSMGLYTPRYGLDDIIETAWRWHRDHPRGYND
ncbi:MAG: UDP-glucose 4-epimerase GalE [Dehalococcoidia bacterium]|jgi:UDP-glucose 4-epimerase